MIGRHKLGDHAAHRRADDMGPLDAERVEKPDRVPGHVIEVVGHVRSLTAKARRGHLLEVGNRRPIEMGRQPGIAVVEPDHLEAPLHEQPAERLAPSDHLHAEPGNQQQRLARSRPEGVVFDGDAVRVDLRHATPVGLMPSTIGSDRIRCTLGSEVHAHCAVN